LTLSYNRKRKIAWIVTISVIILSVIILGSWKLGIQRESVQDYFYNGEDGFSIKNDIVVRTECAYNLLTIAKRTSQNKESIELLKEAVCQVEYAMTVQEYYAANQTLKFAFDILYAEIQVSNIEENDKLLAAKQADEFTSREKTIQRNEYNEKALQYNTEASKFPANILAFLSGTDQLELFRNGG